MNKEDNSAFSYKRFKRTNAKDGCEQKDFEVTIISYLHVEISSKEIIFSFPLSSHT